MSGSIYNSDNYSSCLSVASVRNEPKISRIISYKNMNLHTQSLILYLKCRLIWCIGLRNEY